MTKIQTEVARLQTMANAIVTAFPESEPAKDLANKQIPAIEELRVTARKELDENGEISTEIYNATSAAMAKGEDSAWALYDDYQHATTKLVARQFDNIHIMMNGVNGLPASEGLKCWPPEDPNCP